MEVRTLKRSILQRLFGIPATKIPQDPNCWGYADGKLVIELDRARELAKPGSALRLEGKNLPERLLIVHGEDDNFYTFQNRCRHMGRRLDPVPGTSTVQCCSMGKSTYAYDGKVLYGSVKEAIKTYQPQVQDGKLIINL
jgi:nitrite reductase/ring-hydroxylating ferredoxin subunit